MIFIENIIQTSRKIARSILENKYPENLDDIPMLSDAKKSELLKELKDAEIYHQRIEIKKQLNQKQGWKRIQNRIQKTGYYGNYFKYAAAAAVFLSIGSYLFFINQDKLAESQKDQIADHKIQPGTDKAVLILGDGQTIALGQGTSYNEKGISVTRKKITFKNTDSKIEYNYLKTPRAGQFQLELADGTMVWLNSESQLRFPNKFIEGRQRNVELVYGEAYFKVSPSTKHQGSHFNVKTNGQSVKVLGTEFNIRAYDGENNIVTTLVEGRVKLSNSYKTVTLVPNHQITNNKISNSLQTKSIKVYNDIAWKEGVFSFEDSSLKEIMKVLERWYDVQIQFEDKKIEKIQFTGRLNKSLDINTILKLIKQTNNINYEINQQTIILK